MPKLYGYVLWRQNVIIKIVLTNGIFVNISILVKLRVKITGNVQERNDNAPIFTYSCGFKKFETF